jgi:hypothetical protein
LSSATSPSEIAVRITIGNFALWLEKFVGGHATNPWTSGRF